MWPSFRKKKRTTLLTFNWVVVLSLTEEPVYSRTRLFLVVCSSSSNKDWNLWENAWNPSIALKIKYHICYLSVWQKDGAIDQITGFIYIKNLIIEAFILNKFSAWLCMCAFMFVCMIQMKWVDILCINNNIS